MACKVLGTLQAKPSSTWRREVRGVFMGPTDLQLTDDDLSRIEQFIQTHFHRWLLEDRQMNGDPVNGQLNRIESSLEASIVLSRERFEMMDKRFDLIYKRFEAIDKRFEAMDKRFEAMDKRFEEQLVLTRERFDQVDKRFEAMDRRFTESAVLEKERLDKVNSRMNRQFTVLMVAFGSIFAGVVTILLNGFTG
jgi:uncharacterized membrane-anchored protein